MIQRKQSLWFLVAAIVIGLLFVLPFGLQNSINGEHLTLKASNSMLVMIATCIGIVYNLILIFQYKNRSQQIKLSYLGMVLNLLIAGLIVFEAQFNGTDKKLAIGLLGSQLFLGIFLPFLSIIMQWLAIKGIQQDERLVRDADRLR